MNVEDSVARVLLWGGLIGVLLMVSGVAGQALGGPGSDMAATVSLSQICRGLSRRPWDPVAVTTLGIVVLILTPVVGVALATASFWWRGDRRYAAVAGIVLGALLTSFLLSGPR
jgi:uncharacterized membrane protein